MSYSFEAIDVGVTPDGSGIALGAVMQFVGAPVSSSPLWLTPHPYRVAFDPSMYPLNVPALMATGTAPAGSRTGTGVSLNESPARRSQFTGPSPGWPTIPSWPKRSSPQA